MCKHENCSFCFEHSFASHEKACFWSEEKNNIAPRDVRKCSGKRFYFQCADGHIFKPILCGISGYNSHKLGKWCPKCKHKTERKLNEWFHQEEYQTIYQYKQDWCKNIETGKKLPFDFAIKDKNLIIELDGAQHFRQVSNWKSPYETMATDVFKMTKALENGFSVIRISQEDVWNDVGNWEDCLNDAISCVYDQPTCVFISESEIYGNHMEMLQNEINASDGQYQIIQIGTK